MYELMVMVIVWKDASGNVRSDNLGCFRMSNGTFTNNITAVDRWCTVPLLVQIDNSATAITVLTVGTFTGSPVYNIAVSLKRVL
jgi:hypothetical protein